MSRYIDRVHLMNRIATECHYDTEHPLESYAKLMQVVNEEEGFEIRKYCVYCSFLTYGDCYYCSDKDEVMKESMVKKPNNCPSFSLCPLGHVETGKQYKPREEKQEQIEGQVTIWEGDE